MQRSTDVVDNSVISNIPPVNVNVDSVQSTADFEHSIKTDDTTEEELKNLSEFQKNKFLWEVRSRGTSKESCYNLPYEKKPIAPDLVMDLPISKNKSIFECAFQENTEVIYDTTNFEMHIYICICNFF